MAGTSEGVVVDAEFVIGGSHYRLDTARVVEAVQDLEPESVQKYGVLVAGRMYPVKQVLEAAIPLARSEFTSQIANRILEKVGFQIAGTVRGGAGGEGAGVASVDPALEPAPRAAYDWPWEGAVQKVFVSILASSGWTLLSSADTATKARGVDVLAQKAERVLGAEVKGWPSSDYQDPKRAGESKSTRPSTQAAHWYSQALAKGLMLLDSHPGHESLVVLPDYDRYRKLARGTRTGTRRAGIHIVFITAASACDCDTWGP